MRKLLVLMLAMALMAFMGVGAATVLADSGPGKEGTEQNEGGGGADTAEGDRGGGDGDECVNYSKRNEPENRGKRVCDGCENSGSGNNNDKPGCEDGVCESNGPNGECEPDGICREDDPTDPDCEEEPPPPPPEECPDGTERAADGDCEPDNECNANDPADDPDCVPEECPDGTERAADGDCEPDNECNADDPADDPDCDVEPPPPPPQCSDVGSEGPDGLASGIVFAVGDGVRGDSNEGLGQFLVEVACSLNENLGL